MLNWALVESASARSKNANVLKNAVGLGSANVLKNAAGLMSVTASKNGAGLKSVLSKGSEAAVQSLSGARLNTASELLEFDAVIDDSSRSPGFNAGLFLCVWRPAQEKRSRGVARRAPLAKTPEI